MSGMKRNDLFRKRLLFHIFLFFIISGSIATVIAEKTPGNGKNHKEKPTYTLGKEIEVATGEKEEERPSMAFDGTTYFIVWEDKRSGSFDIYGTRVSKEGTVLDTEGVPISTAPDEQISPKVVWTGTYYLVVWQD